MPRHSFRVCLFGGESLDALALSGTMRYVSLWFGALLLLLAVLPIARGLLLWPVLFKITAKNGKLTLKHGRLPPALFAELADIAEREQLDGVVIRAELSGGQARLTVHGNGGEGALQPMRNVLGRFTVPQLRSGRLRAGAPTRA